MRRQGGGFMASVMAAAMMAGVSIVGVGPSQLSASNGGPTNSGGKASQQNPLAGRRADRFVGTGSSGYGSYAGGYRNRPKRTVAQDKRDARKARNRKRSK